MAVNLSMILAKYIGERDRQRFYCELLQRILFMITVEHCRISLLYIV